jgi:pheromone shutdown-related protein TraB
LTEAIGIYCFSFFVAGNDEKDYNKLYVCCIRNAKRGKYMTTEEHITRVKYNEKELILIATAHVSKASAELVKEVIDREQPDSICVELDEDRYNNMKNPKAWSETDLVQVIKDGKVGFMLANLVLSSYQKKLAKQLDTNVGQEMVQGIQSAEEMGANLVLADRNIQTTFMRIWREMNLKEKFDLLLNLFFALDDDEQSEITDEEISKMLEKDMLEAAMENMQEEFPKVGDILLHERDQYLANKIKNAPGEKVVAVLGGAHVAGVTEEIFKEQDMEEISNVPPAGKLGKMIGWGIPVAIVLLIAWGFLQNIDTGIDMVSSWILWNGSLAALFTALMLGHPLSIITAFVVAPISSLNPMLACGWFAGLMEAHIRKPKVEDVSNISTDIFSIKGCFHNRFIRTLLIVIMANLGSSLGTIIAGMDIIKTIF